jgi:hypothetical protein
MNNNFEIVATCIRTDFDKTNDEIYLVFKIVSEEFKRKVRENLTQDINLLVQEIDYKE